MNIRGENLNLIYDMEKAEQTYALKDININLSHNKFYGVLGPSGSGKSSLLYILSGLKKPTSGKVYYDELDITSLSDDKLSDFRRDNLGFIFQRHFLIEYLTVLQNVLVPVSSLSREFGKRGKELINFMGLKGMEDKKPYQLSGGQRQRVAIARALINNPKVIFADELTASLDHKNAMNVIEILMSICKDSTIVTVTHDESILFGADEIITIWDGIIKERVRGESSGALRSY